MRLNGAVCGILVFAASSLSCSSSSDKAPPGAPTKQTHSIYVSRAMAEGGIVTSTDDDGVPRFVWASRRQPAARGASTEAAAKAHFARFAPAYGLADARGMSVASVGRTPKGQYLVKLRQKLEGLEIHRGEIKLLLGKDRSLIALAGTPSRITGAKTRTFGLAPGQALARALSDLYGVSVPDGQPIGINPDAPTVRLTLPGASTVALSEPARSKKVFARQGDQLVPAYFIEFFSSDTRTVESHAFSYLIAASSGAVLDKRDLTHDVAFNYTVYADDTGDFRPFDGPQESWTPHPTGIPDGSSPPFADPNVVTVETIKTQPEGAVDPWLAANAVQTAGNNADAYADIFPPDGFSNGDLRATINGPLTFDRTYDTAEDPDISADQRMASVTHLFYMINWLHDYWYDSGFTEATGNAQTNNFGRGGLGGDAIRAEAQDGSGLNNANMATPSDGLQPRMQMFMFSSPEHGVVVDPGNISMVVGPASFGSPRFDFTAPVVLANDGVDNPTDACTTLPDATGQIVLADRGVCGFAVKAFVAEQANAAGIIIANNAPGGGVIRMGGTPPGPVTIPAQMVSFEDGATIKALLGGGPVTARMFQGLRDGTLDNMVVSHEWGHYFHHRLQNCGTAQCGAQSEGWGDFIALHTILREGDNLDGTYGMGIYAPAGLVSDSGFFGIRRFTYSVDPTKNALSFRHIQLNEPLPTTTPISGPPTPSQNAEVHNAGEVWASMLFEAYIALQKNPGTRTFDEVRRAFADYVTLGLQLTPDNATFTETRDGILSAILVLNPDDVSLVADAFALRGAGTCAISPPRDSPELDFTGVTESTVVGGITEIVSITLDDSVEICDLDGTLDSGETGELEIVVANRGPVALTGVDVTVSTTTAGASFPGGVTVAIGDLAPFATETVTFQVALDATITTVGLLDLTVTVDSDNGCTASVAQTINPRIHADEDTESSATENVEAVNPPWSKTGTGADDVWTRIETAPGEHVFHGADSGFLTDTQLVSPGLIVSPTDNFVITFAHTYQFEGGDFDGGVIEFSTDNGVTWQDIETLGVDAGYTGTLVTVSNNPLGGRDAYTNDSPSLPDADTVSLDLGTQLAGQTVLIRFRIGTDEAVGAPGWNIDNIAFAGITNTPFTTIIDHAAVCQLPPIANAGPDRTVDSGADVILSAVASSDPNNDPLTFLWTQSSGTGVTLLNPANVTTAFVAPTVAADEDLVFNVEVRDAFASSNDSVTIRVLAPVVDPPDAGPADAAPEPDASEDIDAAPRPDARDDDDDDDDDGGCRVGGSSGSSATFALMLGLAILAVTRRRRR